MIWPKEEKSRLTFGVSSHQLTSTVELERGLYRDLFLDRPGRGQGLFGGIEIIHVGLMMLGVVKVHNFPGDGGLKGLVRVGEVGESCCLLYWGGIDQIL